MLFSIYQDQLMSEKEDISMNAVTIFNVINQLSRLRYIDTVKVGRITYTVLFNNMILQQIPRYDIKIRTLSRVIRELLDNNLLERINENTSPAYALTEKGQSYITSQKSNIGEIKDEINKPKKKKVLLLSLSKATRLENTNDEYKKLLKTKASEYFQKKSLKDNFESDFEDFEKYYISNGKEFVNWLMVYHKWIKTGNGYVPQNQNNKHTQNIGQAEGYNLNEMSL